MTSLNYFLSWKLITRVRNARIINSSLIHLFTIPAAAKLASVAQDYFSKCSENCAPIYIYLANVTLPFNWYLLYLSVIFFALGHIVHMLRCPELFKDYSNFRDFRDSGMDANELDGMSTNYNLSPSEKSEWVHIYTNFKDTLDNETTIQALFGVLSNFLSHIRKESRLIIGVLYSLGFLLLLIIVVENFWAVLQLYLQNA